MKKAIVVVDLGFGDAGKGSVTDYLVRKHGASAVVRYNGGPQAAHRVVMDDGREHVFAQFGSGTFVPGVQTFLSQFMMVNPFNLMEEEKHLQELGVTDALERLAIDARAVVITPFHTAANRLREIARGADRHGSCGQGIGEAMKDFLTGKAITAGRLLHGDLATVLREVQTRKREELADVFAILDREGYESPERAIFEDWGRAVAMAEDYWKIIQKLRLVRHEHVGHLHEFGPVVYEGAQGVLLDQDHGFHPYTTWSSSTTQNARTLIMREVSHHAEIETIGVLRAYATRHGPGPFPTEDPTLDLPDAENGLNRWQGSWRVGHFDAVLANYAIRAVALESGTGVTGLALTCLDRVSEEWKLCGDYSYGGSLTDLDPYFHRSPDGLRAIRLSPYLRSHAHTEAVGTRLLDCKPRYTTYQRDDVVAAVEEWLGKPVVIASHGPTASDKQQLGIPSKALA